MNLKTDTIRSDIVSSIFSKAENSIAQLILDGLTSKEISERACITEKTVKFHLTSLYRKSAVKNRAQFIVKWLPMRFVPSFKDALPY